MDDDGDEIPALIYTCDYCRKEFQSNIDMDICEKCYYEHEDNYTNECDICHKNFKKNYALNICDECFKNNRNKQKQQYLAA